MSASVAARPLLSVIICTFNRRWLLGLCLGGLLLQEVPEGAWEVLAVDNNSTDGSEAEAALFKRAGLPLRHVREPRQGLAHARNRGLAESRGRYLLYLDDDVLPPRGFLAAVLEVIERERPAIAGGPVYP